MSCHFLVAAAILFLLALQSGSPGSAAVQKTVAISFHPQLVTATVRDGRIHEGSHGLQAMNTTYIRLFVSGNREVRPVYRRLSPSFLPPCDDIPSGRPRCRAPSSSDLRRGDITEHSGVDQGDIDVCLALTASKAERSNR